MGQELVYDANFDAQPSGSYQEPDVELLIAGNNSRVIVRYIATRERLCACSPAFSAELSSGFVQSLTLGNVKPLVFAIFLSWLSTTGIFIESRGNRLPLSFQDLIGLWMFATRYSVPQLELATRNRLIQRLRRHGAAENVNKLWTSGFGDLKTLGVLVVVGKVRAKSGKPLLYDIHRDFHVEVTELLSLNITQEDAEAGFDWLQDYTSK